ncbi:hypothetical protein X798_05456 [Onchocerca flexuosa]|uniref:Solute carrier family 40 member n=1 Tax=Onchocerca flexuosa TaxID=387005 RepID=A0A238BRN3_9BILA|nr:hypothetical protein X798_05456 [Onchocerca flexuosa]
MNISWEKNRREFDQFLSQGDRLWTFAQILLLEYIGGIRLSLSLLWHILYIVCIILSIISCSLGCLASEMEKMAFTKDWIIVITEKDESSLSAQLIILFSIYFFFFKFNSVFFPFQIAIGYAKSQGLSALWLGILRSIGAGFGIIGACLYFFIETYSSARRSGLIGLIAQHLALYICFASIWLPGSPFDPITYFKEITFAIWWQQLKNSFIFVSNKNESKTGSNDIDWSTWTSNGHSIISVFTLLMGIAVARLGLYMADLSISQIMQETIPERERNTVFGVQDSVAQFFSVLKVILFLFKKKRFLNNNISINI